MDGCVNIVGANVKRAEHYSNILTMRIINTRCQYCGQGFSTQRGCHRHGLTCDKNPHSISKRTTPRYNKTNQRYAIIDGKRKLISGCSWNKGLTKDIDARVKSYTEKHLHNTYWLGKHHSLETRIKLAKNGGYRHGSGHGKHGVYKGYRCDSSWELAYVIYNLEHDIKFERNHERFLYNLNGKPHYYIPDFICDGKYIEIKGYINESWNAKVEQFPKDKQLVILYEDAMKPYLEYVVDKYGKDFISLYE